MEHCVINGWKIITSSGKCPHIYSNPKVWCCNPENKEEEYTKVRSLAGKEILLKQCQFNLCPIVLSK